MKAFDRLHPIAAFAYFFVMLLVTALARHPVLIALSYLTGVLFCGMLTGLKQLLKSLAYSLPLWAMLALTNPLFSHRGETILFFLNDNPVTKEAVVYGVFAAGALMAMFYWCRNFSTVMTSDKWVYLFGRVLPKLSLVLSLILGFIPKFKRKYREIDEAQRALGIYATQSYVDKIRSKMRVASILLTNCLENSVETADSMRARGYGLKHRSSYAIYRFTLSDGVFLGVTCVLGAASLLLILLGASAYAFYPVLAPIRGEGTACALYGCVACLGLVSVGTETKEELLWRYLRSKI